MLHKGWNLESLNKLPYFRFQMLVDSWSEEIKIQTENQERQAIQQREQMERSQSSYNLPKIEMPNIPKFN